MILTPKTCLHNRKLLCGVVKNLGHCPFLDSDRCGDSNTTEWFAMVNKSFGTITLKAYRYNHLKVKITVLERNKCGDCGVIWADPDNNCLICK